MDRPSTMSCPECGGATRCESHGDLVQYRCHIGHILTAEAMLHAQRKALEYHLGASLALFNEHAELCRRMIETACADSRDPTLLEAARAEALERAEALRSLLEGSWTLP